MWYVNGYLAPELKRQGADVDIYCDTDKLGNLRACMTAFANVKGDGHTWHVQDDILPARDFVKRCEALEDMEGPIYGFCCRNFGDRLDAYGEVYIPDAWNSFQCVRIPNEYARECAAWVKSGAFWGESDSPELPILYHLGNGDDTFFHKFMEARHGMETAYNVKPNLVEHIDWLIGGSSLQTWRDFLAKAEYWEDPALVTEVNTIIQKIKRE